MMTLPASRSGTLSLFRYLRQLVKYALLYVGLENWHSIVIEIFHKYLGIGLFDFTHSVYGLFDLFTICLLKLFFFY